MATERTYGLRWSTQWADPSAFQDACTKVTRGRRMMEGRGEDEGREREAIGREVIR